jgi:hypothetical protein
MRWLAKRGPCWRESSGGDPRTSAPATLRASPATRRSSPATLRSSPATLRSSPATLRSTSATRRSSSATRRSSPATLRPTPAALRRTRATLRPSGGAVRFFLAGPRGQRAGGRPADCREVAISGLIPHAEGAFPRSFAARRAARPSIGENPRHSLSGGPSEHGERLIPRPDTGRRALFAAFPHPLRDACSPLRDVAGRSQRSLQGMRLRELVQGLKGGVRDSLSGE